MEVLQILGSQDQEIDSWFMNQEPLIPTLFENSFYIFEIQEQPFSRNNFFFQITFESLGLNKATPFFVIKDKF